MEWNEQGHGEEFGESAPVIIFASGTIRQGWRESECVECVNAELSTILLLTLIPSLHTATEAC